MTGVVALHDTHSGHVGAMPWIVEIAWAPSDNDSRSYERASALAADQIAGLPGTMDAGGYPGYGFQENRRGGGGPLQDAPKCTRDRLWRGLRKSSCQKLSDSLPSLSACSASKLNFWSRRVLVLFLGGTARLMAYKDSSCLLWCKYSAARFLGDSREMPAFSLSNRPEQFLQSRKVAKPSACQPILERPDWIAEAMERRKPPSAAFQCHIEYAFEYPNP